MLAMHTSPLEMPGAGDAGGLNVFVREVSERLGSRGIEVDIFTRRRDDTTPEIVDMAEGVRVIHVDAGPPESIEKEAMPRLVGRFANAIAGRMRDYDLIHSHYWLSGAVGLELASTELPLVHTMHTMAAVKNATRADGHRPETDEREDAEKAIVAAASVLTANTPEEARELRRHYHAAPSQIAIVHPGVDLHVFHPCNRPASRERLELDPDAQIVLFVGRVQPLKAPDVLIRATAELLRADPTRPLKVLILGSPSGPQPQWAATLPELARELGLSGVPDRPDVVTFARHVPRDELQSWYCASDLVAVPSYNESFGLVAMEAQACGRAVVATDVGGLRHAVLRERTGVLVDGHAPEDWAAAIGSVLDDQPRRLQMERAAAGHAAGFSWDNTASAMIEAYCAAVGLRRL
ncbi:D-inositol-3-phosphate glycosyltransferase [Antricoccus suffuscus]|uniref:D-inositol-3-phosphate glycosyltransferase n=2 Tax=Antricoccus suffuscus TaxID=1629062 RepID=A0A2T1A5L1_9ACTN|nr:D-inositol-3-phosphate glycosyltransferase [Antricoccus suffuscus]